MKTALRLDYVEHVTIDQNFYTVYAIPTTRNRSKTKNTVITFQKRADGCVYPLAAPTLDWLVGYLRGFHECGSAQSLTQEQFLELGGDLKQTPGAYGPELGRRSYTNG